MIIKFDKYNESVKSFLVGPTEDEAWDNVLNGKLKGLIKSIPESSEDFFNKMKDGCIEMDKNRFGTYFGKNGIELFLQNSKDGLLHVSYKYIWSIFEKIYEFNYDETESFIKRLLVNDTKWKDLTPIFIRLDQLD